MNIDQVGFIGLGAMGARMAARLQSNGYALVAYDINRKISEQHLSRDNVAWMNSPRAVAEKVKLIFTSLPGPTQIQAVALGENGLFSALLPGATWFDLSTNSPHVIRSLNKQFLEKGVDVLDAPVSGGLSGAANGKLAIWVGGNKDKFNQYKPVLDLMGDQILYVGDVGSASIAKLVHNCSSMAITCILSEMMSVGVKAGVDPLMLFKAIRQGASGRRRTFDGIANQVLLGKYDPSSFALDLAHKDVALATSLARELGVPTRMAHLVEQELIEALNRGWGKRDSKVVSLLQQERGGISLEVNSEELKSLLTTD